MSNGIKNVVLTALGIYIGLAKMVAKLMVNTTGNTCHIVAKAMEMENIPSMIIDLLTKVTLRKI